MEEQTIGLSQVDFEEIREDFLPRKRFDRFIYMDYKFVRKCSLADKTSLDELLKTSPFKE